MKIRAYKLHCRFCTPSRFVVVDADNVLIAVDLEKDEYVFDAICPECESKIVNRRRAFCCNSNSSGIRYKWKI